MAKKTSTKKTAKKTGRRATGKRLEQVNIHLLKKDVTKYKDALSEAKQPQTRTAKAAVLPGGSLYYEEPSGSPAGWRKFLAPAFDNLPNFHTKHVSAVLFFSAGLGKKQRHFAVTFGYGRALLKDSSLEQDFGLRTALNLCDPSTLRAVNFRTIEDRTRIGRIQLSDAGSVDAFRMNMDTDLLRGVEANSKDKKVCERLGARWSNLIVVGRFEVKDLPALAASLLQYYRKRNLPPEYAWVDNVRRVTDALDVTALDRKLETKVNAQDFTDVRLALPEIAGVTVGVDAKLFRDRPDAEDFTSDFAAYLSKRPRQGDWTVDTAKHSHKVHLLDASTGKARESAPVYRCIVAELDRQGDRYILVDGEWFRISRAFVTEVDEAVSKIPVLKHKYPPWNLNEAEGDWNARACNTWKDAALLDKKTIPYGGGRSQIEPADLLTKDRVFGHAKRRDKSSSGLSHLFAQGVVAAQAIHRDAEFRKKLAKKLPTSHKPLQDELNGTFEPGDWTIAYIVLGADAKKPAETLPFFSKVNLKGASEQLKHMSFKCGIIGI